MLRFEQAATATVGIPSVTTRKCINNLHRDGVDEWQRSAYEPAGTGWHDRRWHRPDHRGRQSIVCDHTSEYPGRETCLPILFPTTIAISTTLISPSNNTKCFNDNQTFHAVAFTVDNVHSCSFIRSNHEHCTDTSPVDASVTNSISMVSRSSDATNTTYSSSSAVGHRPCTTRSDAEGSEDVGMVLRRPVVAGISGGAAIDVARNIPGKGFIRSQIPVLSERPNREGSYKRSSALRLRSIPVGRRTKASTTDASIRVCGSFGGALHKRDERQYTSKRWRRGHKTEQGQPAKPQRSSVGRRPGTHVLSRSSEGAAVQETATSVSATSSEVGDQQESESRRGTTVLHHKPQFSCFTNITTPLTNPTEGLSEGVSVQPLTKVQGRLLDNHSNGDTEVLVKNARGEAADSNTVQLEDCAVEEGLRRVNSNPRHKQDPEGVMFSCVPYLSSMKAFLIVLRYYVPLMILLLESFKLERTRIQQRERMCISERAEEKHYIPLELTARVGYVCKTGVRNWQSSFIWGP